MLTAYTESAVELKAISSSKRKEIAIPRQNGTYDKSKNSRRSARSDRLATDDKSYAAEYLASASAVFFRQSPAYPRSFLWRVWSKQRVLEISSADFARGSSEQEADCTIALEFQNPISPRGVTFCDAGRGDEFYIFILTQPNEVFEIRLRTSYFQDLDSIPTETRTWCEAIPASSLSIDTPFQIHASNPQDVFVSFTSGKVQHWKREDAQQPWSYVNYDDKRWGSSLLSMVSRKAAPDVIFEDMRLASTTTYAIARTGQYLFTACLNHTLKIWHLQSGKLVDTRDLLDQARDVNDRVQLNPANSGHIQFLEGSNKHEQILMTYSPLNGGQIKLWRVRNSFDDDITLFSIEDMVQSSTLQLPDPDPTGSSVWSLSGLRVIFDKQTKDWQAWVLWRNHNHHRAYSLNFGFADITKQWRQDWVEVSHLSVKDQAPALVQSDDSDVALKWLEYIFCPGRYSDAVLETALSQYTAVVTEDAPPKQSNKPLRARLEALVTSQVTLRHYDDSTPNNERFAMDMDQQWRTFWRILETLNEGRQAPLALSIDPLTNAVFLNMADSCCAIRECSNLELLQKNTVADLESLQRVARSAWSHRKIHFSVQDVKDIVVFLQASLEFWSAFPPELESNFLRTLDEDLYTDPDVDSATRVVNFYNQIDFANAVPDDAEQEFLRNLSPIGGPEGITTEMYKFLFDLLSEYSPSREKKAARTKTDFGTELTMAAVYEQIISTRQVLLAMLATAIFVDETEQFDTADNFEAIVKTLKTIERDLWLATHYRSPTPASNGGHASSKVSIMQSLFGDAISPPSSDHNPMPYVLTQHIRTTFVNVSGVNEASPDDAVYLQCNLLRHGDFQLATDFLKFQPSTPWSSYVKGRLRLALGDYREAASFFEEAAEKVAGKVALGQMTKLSSGLLSAAEATHFNNGLPSYYDHIAALFESKQAFDDVAIFTRQALTSLGAKSEEPSPNFRQSMLLRLFSADLKRSNFDKAFEALVQFTDPALQRSSAIDLIDTMLDLSSSLKDTPQVVRQIESLPLSETPHLAFAVDQHIASLAKKQTTIPNAGGLWLSNAVVDYLSILHALRLSRKDYRGAVSALFDRLQIIQKSGRARSDPQAVALRHALLALINILTCVDEDEAYIIANASEDPRIGGTGLKRIRNAAARSNTSSHVAGPPRKRQRIVITLDDLRREYQQVLDRCSRIERGDFEFGGGDDDEDDGMDSGDEGGRADDVWEGSLLTIDKNAKGALQLGDRNSDRMQLS